MIADKEVCLLLDKMVDGVELTLEEREALYEACGNQFRKNRLRRFIDDNYVLLVIGLLLACSCIVVLVTGYDSNLVLFYLGCAVNLVFCTVTVSKSFGKLSVWMLRNKEEKSE